MLRLCVKSKIFYTLIYWNANGLGTETGCFIKQQKLGQLHYLSKASQNETLTKLHIFCFASLVTRTRSLCRGFHRTTWFSWTVSGGWNELASCQDSPKAGSLLRGRGRYSEKKNQACVCECACACVCVLLFSSETVITWFSSLGVDIFFLYLPFHRWHHHFFWDHTRFSLWMAA